MRAFVTGGHGFVGTWLCRHLEAQGDEVVAPTAAVDVTDQGAVAGAMAAAEPEVVYHLAGLAHVGGSWARPDEYLRVNTFGTLQVLEAARRCAPVPRVVLVGSADVYGASVSDDRPIGEDTPLRPVSPYAASKAAAEMVGLHAHFGRHVPVVIARAFNHAGPGQSPAFVVAGIAQRIVAAVASGAGTLSVGNLSPRRDLTDVRDVVRAYRLLAERGQPGEAYNVCSGRAVSVEEVVRRMLALAGAGLELVTDPELVRPVDAPVLCGDPSKLRAATGWEPEHSLDDTLRAVLDSLATR